MQWEYARLYHTIMCKQQCTESRWTDPARDLLTIEEVAKHFGLNPVFDWLDLLQKAGADGWEVFSVTSERRDEGYTTFFEVYFKRSKQNIMKI